MNAVRIETIVKLWTLFWFWRSAAVSLAPSRPHFWLRSIAAAVVLMSASWLFAPLLPEAAWWAEPSSAKARDTRYPSPASEEVLASQPQLLDDALSDLEDQRPGVTDLYFVGFAPDATEDVFRKDIVARAGALRPALRHRRALGGLDQQSAYGARPAAGDRQQPARDSR